MLDRIYSATLLFLTNERGATAMEYALMLGLIVLAALVAFQTLSDSVSSLYSSVNSDFARAMPAGGFYNSL